MAARFLILTLIGAFGVVLSSCQSHPSNRDANHDARVERLKSAGFNILVEPGDLNTAKAYYATIKPQIGLDPETSTLDSLVAHFGYTGLTANDLESVEPKVLMARGTGIIASRFFAPKIVDFNSPHTVPPGGDPFTPGWRKLVILSAQPNSPGAKAGLKSAYILFNVFQENPSQDPFAVESVNNQVILLPASFATGTGNAAYWLDYGKRSEGYKIAYALNAAFDIPNSPGQTKRDYFVPTACAQCHGHDEEFGDSVGGTYPFAKLNYLDTDQWYDMVRFDFPGTAAGSHDVIFDGGKDHVAADYRTAFEIVRNINTEILAQNRTALRTDGSDAFKIAVAEKWLALHANDDQPQPPSARAISVAGGSTWNGSSADDQALLNGLDRFCARCHGSMYYNVFDRQAVLAKKKRLISKISSGSMPQGRTLSATEKSELVALLNKIQ